MRSRFHKKRAGKAPPQNTAEARIEAIGARGDGVAVIDGAKVFVPLTAPGDIARINFAGERGEVETLIEEGPDRANPICRYYGQCGGCALQHVGAEFYRQWKRQIVVDALAREGFDADIVAPLAMCLPSSRRRAVFAARKTAKGVVFGFNARRSGMIVDIEDCPILEPSLAAAVPALRALAAATPDRWRAFDLAATLCDNGIDAMFTGGDAADDLGGAEIIALTDAARRGGIIRLSVDDAPIAMFEAPAVRFAGAPVALPPGGFLQASSEGEQALTAFVTEQARGAKHVADLFCGAGTFSLPLAKTAAVDAFDSDSPAIAALDAAARASGMAHPINASARNLFERPLLPADLKPYDVVVFDPPRAGAKLQAEALAASTVPIVVGVSCNPATFARDARLLADGGYRLTQVLPVDQFVFSAHVEAAGLFKRD